MLWKLLKEKAEATILGSRMGVGGERAGSPLSPNGGEKGLGLVTAPQAGCGSIPHSSRQGQRHWGSHTELEAEEPPHPLLPGHRPPHTTELYPKSEPSTPSLTLGHVSHLQP